MKHRKTTREDILQAAEAVACEGGAAHMTLDAVSKRAGVSKGGLLYHFPNKDNLVGAMILRMADSMERARARESEKLPQGPARELKAHIQAWFAETPMQKKIMAGLLAASAHDPGIARGAKGHFDETFDRFCKDGVRSERAAVVFMAIEGFRFMELLGMVQPTGEQRRVFIEELLSLLEE